MRDLRIGKLDRVRIWQADAPSSADAGLTQAPNEAPSASRHLSVEWYGPRGAFFLYGLLGGHWMPSKKPFALQLCVSPPHAMPPQDWPVSQLGRVLAGLPESLAQRALRGATESQNMPAHGALSIDRAVFSEVGSSGYVFEKLGAALVALLAHSVNDDSDAVLITTLEPLLR